MLAEQLRLERCTHDPGDLGSAFWAGAESFSDLVAPLA